MAKCELAENAKMGYAQFALSYFAISAPVAAADGIRS
jgi:hypothetical protein